MTEGPHRENPMMLPGPRDEAEARRMLLEIIGEENDPDACAARVEEAYHAASQQGRAALTDGICGLAIARDRQLLAAAVAIIERLQLLEGVPALVVAGQNYPRKFGRELRHRMGGAVRELNRLIRALPHDARIRQEIRNIIRQGRCEHRDPEAQTAYAAEWLGCYLRDAQLNGSESAVRTVLAEMLRGQDPVARLAAVSVAGVYRMTELIPAVRELLADSDCCKDPLSERILFAAASQLGIEMRTEKGSDAL